MTEKSYDLLFKILMVGDSGVGKSSIMIRFSDDAFTTNFIPTLGIDFKIKTVEIRGKKIKLQIWDTAGQERFHSITAHYYRGAMGIMLVYDISDPTSFDNITKWVRSIEKHGKSDAQITILGNKCDMEDKRRIGKGRGQVIAIEHGVRFLETSAKNNFNIDKAFMDLSECILDNMLDVQEPQHNLPTAHLINGPCQRCCTH